MSLIKKSVMPCSLRGVVFTLTAFCAWPVFAEYFGTQNGRIARFDHQPPLSVEAGYSFGDFGQQEYKQTGVRINYLATDNALIFGDIGKSDISADEQTSYGVGVYYSVSDYVSMSNEIAIKLSYHQVDFAGTPGTSGSSGGLESSFECNGTGVEIDPFTLDLVINPVPCQHVLRPTGGSSGTPGTDGGKITNIAIEALLSGDLKEVFAGHTTHWYMSLGLHTLGGDVEGGQDFAVGGGFVFPFSDMEFYTGFEYVDESTIGLGLRYLIK